MDGIVVRNVGVLKCEVAEAVQRMRLGTGLGKSVYGSHNVAHGHGVILGEDDAVPVYGDAVTDEDGLITLVQSHAPRRGEVGYAEVLIRRNVVGGKDGTVQRRRVCDGIRHFVFEIRERGGGRGVPLRVGSHIEDEVVARERGARRVRKRVVVDGKVGELLAARSEIIDADLLQISRFRERACLDGGQRRSGAEHHVLHPAAESVAAERRDFVGHDDGGRGSVVCHEDAVHDDETVLGAICPCRVAESVFAHGGDHPFVHKRDLGHIPQPGEGSLCDDGHAVGYGNGVGGALRRAEEHVADDDVRGGLIKQGASKGVRGDVLYPGGGRGHACKLCIVLERVLLDALDVCGEDDGSEVTAAERAVADVVVGGDRGKIEVAVALLSPVKDEHVAEDDVLIPRRVAAVVEPRRAVEGVLADVNELFKALGAGEGDYARAGVECSVTYLLEIDGIGEVHAGGLRHGAERVRRYLCDGLAVEGGGDVDDTGVRCCRRHHIGVVGLEDEGVVLFKVIVGQILAADELPADVEGQSGLGDGHVEGARLIGFVKIDPFAAVNGASGEKFAEVLKRHFDGVVQLVERELDVIVFQHIAVSDAAHHEGVDLALFAIGAREHGGFETVRGRERDACRGVDEAADGEAQGHGRGLDHPFCVESEGFALARLCGETLAEVPKLIAVGVERPAEQRIFVAGVCLRLGTGDHPVRRNVDGGGIGHLRPFRPAVGGGLQHEVDLHKRGREHRRQRHAFRHGEGVARAEDGLLFTVGVVRKPLALGSGHFVCGDKLFERVAHAGVGAHRPDVVRARGGSAAREARAVFKHYLHGDEGKRIVLQMDDECALQRLAFVVVFHVDRAVVRRIQLRAVLGDDHILRHRDLVGDDGGGVPCTQKYVRLDVARHVEVAHRHLVESGVALEHLEEQP